MKDVLDPEFLPVLLKKVAYPTLDDLYAAIGYGGFTAQKAVSRIQGELQRRQQQRQQEQMLAEAVAEPKEDTKPADTPKQPKAVKSEQGIIVEGLDNCLVKFSKCCTPVPRGRHRGLHHPWLRRVRPPGGLSQRLGGKAEGAARPLDPCLLGHRYQ